MQHVPGGGGGTKSTKRQGGGTTSTTADEKTRRRYDVDNCRPHMEKTRTIPLPKVSRCFSPFHLRTGRGLAVCCCVSGGRFCPAPWSNCGSAVSSRRRSCRPRRRGDKGPILRRDKAPPQTDRPTRSLAVPLSPLLAPAEPDRRCCALSSSISASHVALTTSTQQPQRMYGCCNSF
jgi:hypothetical protein